MGTKSHNRSKARIIRALRTRLLAWFDKNKRDLPWRRTRDPYAILVSEIMLQQTRVTTVIPYYERWMRAFPTVHSLARARLDKVLHLWAGLGYYSRARNLHKAAQVIVSGHEAKVPADVAALQQLPGIGRYTSGAIASIAFGQHTPILDGNVIRVLSRLFFIDEDTTKAEVRERLWQLAREIIPQARAGAFNESLMELGALICVPGEPLCEVCPLQRVCLGRAAGKESVLPVVKKRSAVRDVSQCALVVERDGQVLLRQQQEGELMAGLWSFPRFTNRQTLHREYRSATCKPVGQVVHSVMDRKITVQVFVATLDRSRRVPGHGEKWVKMNRLARVALPSADRRIAALVTSELR